MEMWKQTEMVPICLPDWVASQPSFFVRRFRAWCQTKLCSESKVYKLRWCHYSIAITLSNQHLLCSDMWKQKKCWEIKGVLPAFRIRFLFLLRDTSVQQKEVKIANIFVWHIYKLVNGVGQIRGVQEKVSCRSKNIGKIQNIYSVHITVKVSDMYE